MKHLMTYENYSSELKTDKYAMKFLNGEITSLQLENYIFKTNEGVVGDVINWIQEKIIKVLYTFVVTFNKLKTNIISKVLSFITGIMDKIKSFKEKHPILFKGIIIFIIIMIIFLVTESSVSAAEFVDGKLKLTTVDEINVTYGYLNGHGMKELIKGDETGQIGRVVYEAQIYLKDIIDGKIDNPMKISEVSIKFANEQLELIRGYVDKSNNTQDSTMLTQIIKYLKDGQEYVLKIINDPSMTDLYTGDTHVFLDKIKN